MNLPTYPRQNDDALIVDPTDRLLDDHLATPAEQIVPSSGFILSVMESIHAQAAEPPPIAFPWRRVLPGIVATACGLIALAIFALRAFHASAAGGTAPQPHLRTALSVISAFTPGELTLLWVALATCLSIAAVALSFRLTGRRQ